MVALQYVDVDAEIVSEFEREGGPPGVLTAAVEGQGDNVTRDGTGTLLARAVSGRLHLTESTDGLTDQLAQEL